MEIRKAALSDLPRLLEIFEKARTFMRANGNMEQWTGGYPSAEVLTADIEAGFSHVCIDEDEIVATFFFAPGPDPTYAVIYEGAWASDEPYHVVHRIAADGKRKGIASFCLQWCAARDAHLRIDTHRDNFPMQKAVEKNGFVYRGIIHLLNGDERLAYERV
ncbi:MAG: GNAT family N-acetyltransferase [Oscillospiraceae bacterium]|nr:GNAT family N-acetyltransferase [Oscillospiraceae bacterium]